MFYMGLFGFFNPAYGNIIIPPALRRPLCCGQVCNIKTEESFECYAPVFDVEIPSG